MTEETWLTTDKVADMIHHARRRGRAADRNRRLRRGPGSRRAAGREELGQGGPGVGLPGLHRRPPGGPVVVFLDGPQ